MAVIHTTACEELIRQIESLADPGDLGPDEIFSTTSSIERASAFLRELYQQEDDAWPTPIAGPEFDSGVGIHWRRAGREARVHIACTPQFEPMLAMVEGGLQSTNLGVATVPALIHLLDWVAGRD